MFGRLPQVEHDITPLLNKESVRAIQHAAIKDALHNPRYMEDIVGKLLDHKELTDLDRGYFCAELVTLGNNLEAYIKHVENFPNDKTTVPHETVLQKTKELTDYIAATLTWKDPLIKEFRDGINLMVQPVKDAMQDLLEEQKNSHATKETPFKYKTKRM